MRIAAGLRGGEVRHATGVERGVELGRHRDGAREHAEDRRDVFAFLRSPGIELCEEQHVDELGTKLDDVRC